MSEPPEPNEPPSEADEPSDAESRAVRDLLKRSLAGDSMTRESPDLLIGVQRRIRKRSHGKFFADGWSTTQARASYVLVAVVTLLLVALAFFALGPMDIR